MGKPSRVEPGDRRAPAPIRVGRARASHPILRGWRPRGNRDVPDQPDLPDRTVRDGKGALEN